VGSSGVEVLSSVSTLDEVQNTQRLFNFEVPEGTEHLRVSLNGDDGRGNDFDLYVRAGSPPTDVDYDCRPFATGNPEACDFPSPVTGTWYIRIVRFAGEGTFQTTATLFGAASSIFADDFEGGGTNAWSSAVPGN
jgi:vibriolysin